ncbi:MAG: hypothetical protein GY835_08200 [bacterium]|nr:hypothetical protein [bacterium]
MRISIRIIISIIVMLAVDSGQAQEILPDSLLLPGLEAAGLRPEELSCFPETNKRDTFRLPIVDSLMTHPADSDRLLAPLFDDLIEPAPETDPFGAPELSLLSRIPTWLHSADAPPAPLDWEESRFRLLEELGEAPDLPERYLHNLIPTLVRQRASALRDLTAGELELLLAESAKILEEDEDTSRIYDPLTLRRIEMEAEERSLALMALWEKVNLASLYHANYTYVRDLLFYAHILYLEGFVEAESPPELTYPDGFTFPDGSTASGPLYYARASDYGNLVIGAAADNIYTGDFSFILDLAGDDTYSLKAPWPHAGIDLTTTLRGFRCLLDIAGNDLYEGLESGGLAGAYFGASLLVDRTGDDIYRATSFDLGCGWFGLGVLADQAGDDYYYGDTAVIGAGGLGVGLLLDDEGMDVYRSHLYSQGFGYVGGSGLLLDRGGNDLYAVTPKYTDILRYEDHSLTLSQGFAIGARPDYSGGIGILDDGGTGNDAYFADIYGQGSAYWYSLGLLRDHGGNDRYEAYQYSQGAGIHLAVGMLLDDGGDDSYSGHGVGQGCGHDLAFGLLRDCDGNDLYSCADLSLGAGSANGIGVLLDGSGLDGYLTKGIKAPGYGNPRRNFGSVGLLVDGSGEDWVSRPVATGERIYSTLGVFKDMDYPQEGPVWDPGPAIPFRDSTYTWSEYFLLAGSGEPRFREWQEKGMEVLSANPDGAIEELIGFFDTRSARQRHRLKDIMRAIGKPAVEPLREVLRRGPESHRGMAVWCLENIGDGRAYPELLSILNNPRHYRDEVAVLSAMARLQDLSQEQLAELEEICEKLAARPGSHPFVLKEVAFLLRRQPIGSSRLLLELATADHYAPRWVAATALGEREGWGGALKSVWRDACADPNLDKLLNLCPLLPHRPAREVRARIRGVFTSRHGDSRRLRGALLRALLAHPHGDGIVLGDILDSLSAEQPGILSTLE